MEQNFGKIMATIENYNGKNLLLMVLGKEEE